MLSLFRRFGRASLSQEFARFLDDDSGQDTVEYALLAAFIGVAGWAVLMTLPGVIGNTYDSWLDPTNGVPGKWDPPEPASAGS